jgi:hypothetical protein
MCSSSDWLSRIEPAARRAMICSASARLRRLRSTQSAQPLHDRLGLDRREVEPLAARQDRDRESSRFGRAEDELHVLGRLFQRLEQRVEGLVREHVDFVDDVNLEPRAAGPDVDVLPQAGGSRRCRGCWRRRSPARRRRRRRRCAADVALVAGRGVGPADAVERLGEDPGRRGLADAAGAGEQIGVPDADWSRWRCQRLRDVLLADQLVESCGR